ncbi:cation-translocating P-type ATPase [Oscillospiraceae bacterium MB08-C2-2]|nr:cation-translocating P-type ATPase [Oscillospiraceae bacterium MB08-C2-2]
MYEQKNILQSCEELDVNPQMGLSSQQAAERLQKYGPNALVEAKPKSKLSMFLSQLNDPMIYILFAAAAISMFLREWGDAVIILMVVLLNAIVGMSQEAKAEQALEALKKLSSPFALVRRDGKLMDVPAAELVLGDVVVLEAGRVLPADLRLISSINLKVEESALTGESVPVEKDSDFVATGDTSLGDRVNMAFSSTSVTYGRGEGIVAATGMNTEIGKIATMINQTATSMTPLQKRLADLSKLLGGLALAICVAMFAIAIIQQRPIVEMLLTAISLAVAAIPEGLPAVVTIVLALGVQRMVKVNTIVRRLPSVETLGAVSVVCSDKTGTLTQNKMTVTQVYRDEKLEEVSALAPEQDQLFLEGFVLCNDASIKNGTAIGDPTEIALLDMGARTAFSREGLEETLPRVAEQAFDSDRKMMTTVHRRDGKAIAFTKGAMDILLSRCENIIINGQVRPLTQIDREKVFRAASSMAHSALRVLALAFKENDESATEENLTFVGLVGMIDPPRPEAAEAVQVFKDAKIRTVMITGDHKDTALAIARELKIADSEEQCMTGEQLSKMTQDDLNRVVDDVRVFARVSPEHKVMIVKALKSHGYIVSMTGDGVNDAPSLKTADIGVAMGITGTDVAKGAADMVLTDDNFATIEKAVAEGRGIYSNIKKSVLFLLSSNFGEVITMFGAILAGLAAPLQATHILFVNLLTDTLPALALGVDSKDKDIMKAPPRHPEESLFAHGGLALTLFYGVVIAAMTLGAFLYSPVKALMDAGSPVTFEGIKAMLGDTELLMHAQTYAFVTLALSQLFHAFGMRNVEKSIFRINPFENRTMVMAFVIGLLLQVAVTEIPLLTGLFGTVALSFMEWLELFLLAMVPLVMHELIVLVRWIFKAGKTN